jgi:hypothetical protein
MDKRYFNINSTRQPAKGIVHTAFSERVANEVGTSVATIVEQYLIANPPAGGLSIDQIKADTDIASAISEKHVSGSDNQNLSGLVEKVTGKALSANDLTDLLKTDYDSAVTLKHSNSLDHSNSQDHSHSNASTLNSVQEALTTSLKSSYDGAVTHAGSSHAPSNAQKNSDITGAEIEAKLTGSISSHSHASSGGLTQQQILRLI